MASKFKIGDAVRVYRVHGGHPGVAWVDGMNEYVHKEFKVQMVYTDSSSPYYKLEGVSYYFPEESLLHGTGYNSDVYDPRQDFIDAQVKANNFLMVGNPDEPILKAIFKDGNPKDAVGTKKASLSVVPLPVIMEVAAGMFEGARKYGRHNYRVSGVRHSVYFDATIRHLFSWWEGEDIDPDSGLSHITKAISSLVVLRDAMMRDMATDDRPPASSEGWMKPLHDKVGELIDKHPKAAKTYTNNDQVWEEPNG